MKRPTLLRSVCGSLSRYCCLVARPDCLHVCLFVGAGDRVGIQLDFYRGTIELCVNDEPPRVAFRNLTASPDNPLHLAVSVTTPEVDIQLIPLNRTQFFERFMGFGLVITTRGRSYAVPCANGVSELSQLCR